MTTTIVRDTNYLCMIDSDNTSKAHRIVPDIIRVCESTGNDVDVFVVSDFTRMLAAQSKTNPSRVVKAVKRLSLDEREVFTAMTLFRRMKKSKNTSEIWPTLLKKSLPDETRYHFLDIQSEPYIYHMKNVISTNEGGNLTEDSKTFITKYLNTRRAFERLFMAFPTSPNICRFLNLLYGAKISSRRTVHLHGFDHKKHLFCNALDKLPTPMRRLVMSIMYTGIRSVGKKFIHARRTSDFCKMLKMWHEGFLTLEKAYVATRALCYFMVFQKKTCVLLANKDTLRFLVVLLKLLRKME